jgi:predicted ATPase
MTTKLSQLMKEPEPKVSYQRRLSYRPKKQEVIKLYAILNEEIFDNQLPKAKLEIKSHCRGYWGMCIANEFSSRAKTSRCVIRVSDRWYSKHWLITILAHEMVHQYQWDIYSKERVKEGKFPLMSHGPSFFKFKNKLKEHGIELRRIPRRPKWLQPKKQIEINTIL